MTTRTVDLEDGMAARAIAFYRENALDVGIGGLIEIGGKCTGHDREDNRDRHQGKSLYQDFGLGNLVIHSFVKQSAVRCTVCRVAIRKDGKWELNSPQR